MTLRVVFFQGNQDPAFADAAAIREAVFLHEQKFTAEFDHIDAFARHAVVYDGDIPAATGRLFTDEEGACHIGRVAVQKAYRKLGVGVYLMQALESLAAEQGVSEITLSAQVRAAVFYEKLGYTRCGQPFYDEYCAHISMRKQL